MFVSQEVQPQLTLIAGASLLYAAGRASVVAIAGNAASPGRRAIAHWLPIVAVVAVAVARQQGELALAVIFATSVASLSLVAGCVNIMGFSHHEPTAWPGRTRVTTGLLLPVAMLALLAGFAGRLGWLAGALLAVEGAVVGFVWLDPEEKSPADRKLSVRAGPLVLAIALAAGGAWLAVKGTLSVSVNLEFPSPSVVATMALSPLLVAPMLLGGSTLAQHGQSWAATGTQVGLAQLNLVGLLPLAALAWLARWGSPLAYPVGNWRVDAVVLVLLAATLLPVAAGRWRPGRMEGVALLGIYVGYVLAVIFVAVRS